MNIDFNKCLYLNAEKQNSEQMLNPCINGFDSLSWSCDGRKEINTMIQSRNLERPSGDNIEGNLPHSLNENKVNKLPKKVSSNSVEGFTNLGESHVPEGECPDGYYWCQQSQKCVQLCQNCKYNETKYRQSKEFNEYDPCFPNQGVYAGIDNEGYTQCTCGKDGRYCNNMFDTQGGMFYNDVYVMNVGDYFGMGDLASY